MDTFQLLLEKYALIVVLVGLVSCILTNFIKLPVQKAYRNKAKTDPALTDLVIRNKLRTLCTLCVTAFCLVGMLLYYGLTMKSWQMFLNKNLYVDFAAAVAAAKIIYAAYESGDLKFSPKQIWHKFRDWLKKVTTKTEKIKTSDVTDLVQDILLNDIGLPLTDDQKEALTNALNGHTALKKETAPDEKTEPVTQD